MELMVSVCCATYNQEEYIEDALKGFVMQKTSFKYEVLVHDDASTDNTAKVIKEYEEKYPDLIKPIYQNVNQTSLGIGVTDNYIIPRAKGKYLALCEGDDYWTDPYKLQKQFDYMEKNPDCSLCVHSAKTTRNEKESGYVRPNNKDCIYSTEDVILGGGGMFATASMFFPVQYAYKLPDFCRKAPIGDYPLTIYLSLMGNVFYMVDCMSTYRLLAKNSWSSKMNTCQKRTEHNNKIEKMLEEIDEYTNHKYSNAIKRHIIENQFGLYRENCELRKIKNEKYAEFYSKLTFMQKTKLHLKKIRNIFYGLRNEFLR